MAVTDTRRGRVLFVVGLLAVAFNLRPAIVTVSPVLEVIRADLGLSYTALSLLTTLPVLCLGVFAFAAPWLGRRFGRVRSVLYGTVLVVLATALRAVPSAAALFASALLVGVGIAVCQTFLPAIVGEYLPSRAAGVTGLYSAGTIAGAAVASGAVAPLADRLGGWPLALAVWALPAVAGVAGWGAVAAADDGGGDDGDRKRGAYRWRDPSAVTAVLFFCGLVIVFFSTAAWVPPLYVDRGFTPEAAGLLLSVFFATSLVASLLLSAVGDRTLDRPPWYALSLGALLVGLAGMTVAPLSAPFVLAVLVGFGNGAVFPLALTLPVDLGATTGAADRLSAMMFGVGYALGSAGPLAVGALRDLLGSFVVPFAGLTAVTAGMCLAAVRFAPRYHDSVE